MQQPTLITVWKSKKLNFMSHNHSHNNQINQSQEKDEEHKRNNNHPLLIVVSTSVDRGHGGEGGGAGMTPTDGLGPPPTFLNIWKHQSASFLRQQERYCLLYQLRLRGNSQCTMMHEQHHNSSWKMTS